jgi:hypothetical protein
VSMIYTFNHVIIYTVIVSMIYTFNHVL